MAELIRYPDGALLRVKQICTDTKTGAPGILPIVPRTWYKWVKAGLIPEGVKLGSSRAWPIEVVRAVGRDGITVDD